MPWCTPSTLEELSSRVVAESIVCASEHKIRKHMLTVSSKVLRHHVKLGQLNDVAISETSDVGRNKSAAQCSSGSPSSTRYPISEKKLQEYASSRRRRDTNISAVKSEIADVPCLCPSNPEECCFQKSMIAVKVILRLINFLLSLFNLKTSMLSIMNTVKELRCFPFTVKIQASRQSNSIVIATLNKNYILGYVL